MKEIPNKGALASPSSDESPSLSAPQASRPSEARPVAGGRRLSFREAMSAAEEQVMLNEYFEPDDRPHAREVCRVMAEVYMMNPAATVKVCEEEREAGMVAEVFRELTPEDVQGVVDKIHAGALQNVRNPRAYMRTMLYNEVFEADIKAFESVRREWGWRG